MESEWQKTNENGYGQSKAQARSVMVLIPADSVLTAVQNAPEKRVKQDDHGSRLVFVSPLLATTASVTLRNRRHRLEA